MRTLLLLFFILSSFFLFSQNDIQGDWYGRINAMGSSLRINLHFYKDSTTLDSPDQNTFGLKAKKTKIGDSIFVYWENLNAKYTSTDFNTDTIIGTYEQSGRKFDLNLSRKAIEKPVYKRPQNPKPPYDYDTANVSIPALNEDFNLAGTLIDVGETVVVLASGSGPQNRNSEMMHHKPFWVIADYLAQHGISSLRFDDRGIGNSEGDFSEAAIPDFANDIQACVNFLQDKGFKNIGVIGHSEGGMTAPLAATENKKIDFIILLAPPGVVGSELILRQQEIMSKQAGFSEEEIQKALQEQKRIQKALRNELTTFQDSLRVTLNKMYDEALENGEDLPEKNQWLIQNMMTYGTKWYRNFIMYDPIPTIKKVKVPVGIIQGENDVQVEAEQNTPPLRAALEKGKTKTFKIKRIPKLNHLLQESETGSFEEYAEIEQTIHPQVLELIVEWTKEFTK